MPPNSKKIKKAIKEKTGRTTKPKKDSPHRPTDENRAKVLSLAEDGLSREQIRYYILDSHGLPISSCTLQEYYNNEYEAGVANMTQKVAANLIRIASKGSNGAAVSAGQYVLGCKAGWKQDTTPTKIEVTGPDGKPIKHDHTIDVSKTVGDLFATIAAGKASGSIESNKLAEDSEG